MADKIDPYDVAALERSLNDSATRVSTIWVSYLVFGLYLVTAAGNVTHRQLFIEEPIKLPVLNIDLPIVGFFFLAPILFVIFHVYVLIQVVLLARTAATYNEAVEKKVMAAPNRARVRQRLANTLFAQIFAGSPRERQGPLGTLLRLMAWTTLAIAPLLVLLTFDLKFLPYHSHLATWTHRFLIAFDLIAILLLWPGALNARQEIIWHGLLQNWKFSFVAILIELLVCTVPSFPGEFHAHWSRYLPNNDHPDSSIYVGCRTTSPLAVIFSNFDRLSLPREDFVDDDKLAKLEVATNTKQLESYQGERTRSFRGRDMACGLFAETDLRRVDFSGAILSGANFDQAELQGSVFSNANLRGSSFVFAKLHEAVFSIAKMQSANLTYAKIQGAKFEGTKLQGAAMAGVSGQGANFNSAAMQGASLSGANLQGATFFEIGGGPEYPTSLRGANLSGAELQGANLSGAELQAADFSWAKLQGVDLSRAQLQGAKLDNADLTLAILSNAALWRATGATCENAQVINPLFFSSPVLEYEYSDENSKFTIKPSAQTIHDFVETTLKDIPVPNRADLQTRLQGRFENNINDSDSEKSWRICAENALAKTTLPKKRAEYLLSLTCKDAPNKKYIVNGLVLNWIATEEYFDSKIFARGLLGLDGEPCPGASELDPKSKILAIEHAAGLLRRSNGVGGQ